MALHFLGGEHFRNRDLKIFLDFVDPRIHKKTMDEEITEDMMRLNS